jgi:aryl-alcohol dehydrogenase-like predicted oxidoreductase
MPISTRPLGQSGPLVSTLCLGTMTFGTPVAERDAIALIHAALDIGVTFIDTADIYEGYKRELGRAGGEAEEIVGKALADRPGRAVVTTKVGNSAGEGPGFAGLGRTHIRRQAERSLRNLRTDCIDVYELHKPDPETPLTDTLTEIAALLREGKIRVWGFSNYPADQALALIDTATAMGLPKPAVCQPLYNWLNRGIEADLLPLCCRHGIGVTPYQPLQGGVLSGKYRADAPPPAGSRAVEQARWLPAFDDELFSRLATFESDAQAAGRSPLSHALNWLLDQAGVTSVVVGCKSIPQLSALVAAL